MTSRTNWTCVVIAFLLLLSGASTASAFYNPSSGRFLSRDPIIYPDGANTYAAWYVPSQVDPHGTVSIVCNCYKTVYHGGGPTSTGSHVSFVVTTNCTGLADSCCTTACGNGGGTYEGPGRWELPTAPPSPGDGPGYGNYCGPRCRTGKPPIDCLDAACKQHDSCMGTVWDWVNPLKKMHCEMQLCAAASTCDCSRSPDPFTCRTARFYIMLYSCAKGVSPLPIL
jgi:hypothetical protein